MAEFLVPYGIHAITKGIRKFEQDTNRMNVAMEKVSKSTRKAADSFQRAISPAQVMGTRMALLAQKHQEAARAAAEHKAKIDNFIVSANKVGTVMLAMAGAGTAAIASSTLLAARVETLGIVTKTLGATAGKTEGEIRALEKAIQAKGITVQASRQALAMMMQAEIELAHATNLARLAQDAAVIANKNSSEAFEHLVYVIQTGNIRMARTLGLQVRFGKSYEETAERVGVAVDALTEQQRVESRVQAVLKAGIAIQGAYAAAMETAGKQWTSLPRYIEEARRSFGEVFLPIMYDTVQSITNLLTAFTEMPPVLRAGAVGAAAGGVAFLAMGGAILKLIGPIQSAIAWLTNLTIAQAAATAGITLLLGAIAALVITHTQQAAKSAAAEKGLADLTRESLAAGDSYEEFNKKQEEWRKENEVVFKQQVEMTRGMRVYGDVSHIVADQIVGDVERVSAAQYAAQQIAQQQLELNRMRTYSEEQMRAAIRLTVDTEAQAAQAIQAQEQALADYITAAHATTTASRDMWDSMKPDVQGIIKGYMELIEFYLAGGYEIQLLAQNIGAALKAGLDPQVAYELLADLEPAAIAIGAEIGGDTGWEYQKALRAAVGPEEAKELADATFGDLPGFAEERGAEVAQAFSDALALQAREEDLAVQLGLDEIALPVEFLMTLPEDLEGALQQAGISEALINEIVGAQDAVNQLDFTQLEANLKAAIEAPINTIQGTLSQIPSLIKTDWVIDVSYTGQEPRYEQAGRTWTVQGTPGVDKVPVQFMATQGEEVTVTPAPHIDNRSVNVGGVNIHNQIDQHVFDQAMRRWLGG